MWRYLAGIGGAVPALVLFGAIHFHRWNTKRLGRRLPIKDKLLRPPGYSLGLRLDNINDDFSAWLVAGYLSSLACIGTLSLVPVDVVGEAIFFGIFGSAAAMSTVFAWRKWLESRRVRLGLLGEQAVAEQLTSIICKGYRVFHDVPGGGKWNIDHVVVGPTGVFAIETKTRVKRPGHKGESDFQVSFDGNNLGFPGYTDKKIARQTRANTAWISEMLSKATGDPVKAIGIVALPGWMVERARAEGELQALNAKEIPKFIINKQRQLPEAQIERIAYQLEQRCRDVGF